MADVKELPRSETVWGKGSCESEKITVSPTLMLMGVSEAVVFLVPQDAVIVLPCAHASSRATTSATRAIAVELMAGGEDE